MTARNNFKYVALHYCSDLIKKVWQLISRMIEVALQDNSISDKSDCSCDQLPEG